MQFKLFCFVLSFMAMWFPETLSAQSLQKERKDKDLKILLISDLNDSYGSVTYSKEVTEAVGKIKQLKPDLILCAGDMVAGQKQSLTPDQIEAMWKGFDKYVMKPVVAMGIPFGFTVGNHDASPNFIKERTEASKYWLANKSGVNLPMVDDANYPYFFSYLKNNVFIISWDASASKITGEVKNWLRLQLTSEVARQARFRIVMGHLPLYAIVDSKNKQGEVLAEATEIESLFSNLNVDMYISGHQHAYFPAQAKSLILMHAGCLGGGPRSLIGDPAEAKKAYAWIEIPRKNVKNDLLIKGFNGTTNEEIDLQSLPRQVTGFNGTVIRRDN